MFGSGVGSLTRDSSDVTNVSVSADRSRTSSTTTSTAVANGSSRSGGAGNGGVVSDSSMDASAYTTMR